MTFDKRISLGNVLAMITMLIGGVGAFYTVHQDSREQAYQITLVKTEVMAEVRRLETLIAHQVAMANQRDDQTARDIAEIRKILERVMESGAQ
ncbi:MAG: hypothetical protein AAF674_22580 [Pseudomonadota bacterium]